jgi:hypothetical protein
MLASVTGCIVIGVVTALLLLSWFHDRQIRALLARLQGALP